MKCKDKLPTHTQMCILTGFGQIYTYLDVYIFLNKYRFYL